MLVGFSSRHVITCRNKKWSYTFDTFLEKEEENTEQAEVKYIYYINVKCASLYESKIKRAMKNIFCSLIMYNICICRKY